MPSFCTTRSTASQIESVIQTAKRQLTLISPYLQIPNGLLPRLRAADARGVEIRLIFRTDKLNLVEREKLTDLKGISLYSLDNLHAKCYANEHAVLISSMNLYQYSEQNNWEMSVLLTEQQDKEAIREARGEIESIIREATPHATRGLRGFLANTFGRVTALAGPNSSTAPSKRKVESQQGVCIRCSVTIRYRPTSPLCQTCYSSWAAWGNEHYPEKCCHRCAEPADVRKAKPLCYECFCEAPFVLS